MGFVAFFTCQMAHVTCAACGSAVARARTAEPNSPRGVSTYHPVWRRGDDARCRCCGMRFGGFCLDRGALVAGTWACCRPWCVHSLLLYLRCCILPMCTSGAHSCMLASRVLWPLLFASWFWPFVCILCRPHATSIKKTRDGRCSDTLTKPVHRLVLELPLGPLLAVNRVSGRSDSLVRLRRSRALHADNSSQCSKVFQSARDGIVTAA